ncbi:MAG: extracellular solute-binding protein [Chloroflexi bacterium]|nr:extracellular solute-binding protein [Chloroflexota bacterium]
MFQLTRILLVIGLLAIIAVACAPASPTAPPPSAKATDKPVATGATQVPAQPTAAPATKSSAGDVKLTVWFMGADLPEQKEFSKITAQKFKEVTGITVVAETISWGDAIKKITTAVAAGEGPDVTMLGSGDVASFYQNLVDLTDEFGKTLPPTSAFVEGAFDGNTYNKHTYAIPYMAQMRSQAYRKDLWSEAGLPNGPTTWAELREGALKIKKAHPELDSTLGMRGQGVEQYAVSMMWQNCSDMISEDGKKATFNHPNSVEAIQYFAEMVAKDGTFGLKNSEWAIADVGARFWDGKLGWTWISNTWVQYGKPDQITAMQPKVGYIPPPIGNKGCQLMFSPINGAGIFKWTRQPAAAKQWLAFLLQPEMQALYYKLLGHLPVVTSAYDLPDVKAGGATKWLPFAKYGKPYTLHPATSEVALLLGKIIPSIYASVIDKNYNDTTVQKILDDLNKKAQESIDKNPPPPGFSNPWPKPVK